MSNSKIQRPSDYSNTDGFLMRMSWDGTENKSALFFFSRSRTVGSGDNARKIYTDFTVRFWGQEAQALAWLLDHKNAEEAAGRKYPLLINLDARMASWKKPTGKMVGQNNDVQETTTVSYFEGKNSKMMDLKSYDVLYDTKTYQVKETTTA